MSAWRGMCDYLLDAVLQVRMLQVQEGEPCILRWLPLDALLLHALHPVFLCQLPTDRIDKLKRRTEISIG